MANYIRLWLNEHKIKTSNKKKSTTKKNPTHKKPHTKTKPKKKPPQKVLQNQKNKHIPRAKFKVHKLMPLAEVLM